MFICVKKSIDSCLLWWVNLLCYLSVLHILLERRVTLVIYDIIMSYLFKCHGNWSSNVVWQSISTNEYVFLCQSWSYYKQNVVTQKYFYTQECQHCSYIFIYYDNCNCSRNYTTKWKLMVAWATYQLLFIWFTFIALWEAKSLWNCLFVLWEA